MPSERRKEQNRTNQRRYRMQMKSRIQMLEQALIEGRTPLDLVQTSIKMGKRTPEGTSTQVSTPTIENLQPQNGCDDPAPNLLVENFLSWDAGLTGSCEGMPFFDSNASEPWIDASPGVKHFDDDLSLPSLGTPIFARENSTEHIPPVHSPSELQSEGPSIRSRMTRQRPTRGKPRKNSNDHEIAIPPRKRHQSDKEKIIASLRAENKRLRELSTALVKMWDGASTSQSQIYDGCLQIPNASRTMGNNYVTSPLTSCNTNDYMNLSPECPFPMSITDAFQDQPILTPGFGPPGAMQYDFRDPSLSTTGTIHFSHDPNIYGSYITTPGDEQNFNTEW